MTLKTKIQKLFYVKFRPSRFNQLLRMSFFPSLLVVTIGMAYIDHAEKATIELSNRALVFADIHTQEPVVPSAQRDVTPVGIGVGGTIVEKIRAMFPEDPDTAVAIAFCESRLDPKRIGDTHMKHPSIGLFQINQTWHKFSTEELQNPDENIRIAKEIKDRWGNWNAWSCYKQGFYKQHLSMK